MHQEQLNRILPLIDSILKLDTNVPDPNKRVKKGAKKPEVPENILASAEIKVNGDDPQEVTLVGDRISQDSISLYNRLDQAAKQSEKASKYLKEILYQAHQKGVPVREGLRNLESWGTETDNYSYSQAFEDLFEVVEFLVTKFRQDFEEDETAQQLLVEKGVLREDGESLALSTKDQYRGRYHSTSVRKNLKVITTG